MLMVRRSKFDCDGASKKEASNNEKNEISDGWQWHGRGSHG